MALNVVDCFLLMFLVKLYLDFTKEGITDKITIIMLVLIAGIILPQ